jgi:hypothetical protein
MLVHAVGANTFIIVRIMEPFWFLTGIIITLPMIVEAGGVPPEGQRLSPLRSPAVASGLRPT